MYNWKHIDGLKLADSDPMSSDSIDIIIGANLFGKLVLNDVQQGSENESTAQNTTVGWIVSGPIAALSANESNSEFAHQKVVLETFDYDFPHFWETEEIPQKASLGGTLVQGAFPSYAFPNF